MRTAVITADFVFCKRHGGLPFHLLRYARGASFRSSRGGSPFLKDEKRGKRIFLRGRLPYARENKKGTSRLTLKRNANVASLPLLFLMRKARTHKTKGSCLARIYPSFGAKPKLCCAGFQKGGSPLAFRGDRRKRTIFG